MKLNAEILKEIEDSAQEALDLLIELGKIPAPSHQEHKRAEFCKNWLIQQGAKGVYIDEALNVVYPVGCTDDNPVVVFAAHTDVVFPDTETLPMTVADGKVYCPGIGDDTIHVVALLMVAKYVAQHNLVPENGGILFVANSCEEGLGNLKGVRKIAEQYGSRMTEFVTFDGPGCSVVNKAVGSKRYKIEIDTEGGHSYSRFGNRNAIVYLASLIDTLYALKVPTRGKTTYNVGTISGGTSVNTIAQYAEMLYEFRSDERASLAVMEEHFNAAIQFYRTKGIDVEVELLSERPCSGEVDAVRHEALMVRAAAASLRHCGMEMDFRAGSTDCNIPLSMGVPAICTGCYTGGGAHTREEWLEIDSLLPGLKVAFELVLHHF